MPWAGLPNARKACSVVSRVFPVSQSGTATPSTPVCVRFRWPNLHSLGLVNHKSFDPNGAVMAEPWMQICRGTYLPLLAHKTSTTSHHSLHTGSLRAGDLKPFCAYTSSDCLLTAFSAEGPWQGEIPCLRNPFPYLIPGCATVPHLGPFFSSDSMFLNGEALGCFCVSKFLGRIRAEERL